MTSTPLPPLTDWLNTPASPAPLPPPPVTDRTCTCTQANPALTAELTLRTLRRRVPPAVPGVFFLSGGQSEEDATVNLDLINRTAAAEDAGRRYPWSMSFSFGRSLQASVLKVWRGGGGREGRGGEGSRVKCCWYGRAPWAAGFWRQRCPSSRPSFCVRLF